MTVTLLMPVYNEIDGMRSIIPRLPREGIDQVLVADGGSTDGSLEYARSLGFDVVVQKKAGLRNALAEAFPKVTGDIVVTFSPDGNSIPEAIPELVRKIREGNDLVIGSRYLGAATSEDDSFMSRLGNWGLTRLINLVFGGKYTDTLVILRAFRKEVITNLHLVTEFAPLSPHRYFAKYAGWDSVSSIRAAKAKLRIAEIPASEPARIGGVSKCMHYRNGLYILAEILHELIFWKVPPESQELSEYPAIDVTRQAFRVSENG